MGRKKKKINRPWCWYCNREFDDEKILLQHQKAKHFKCHICHKKLFTGPGLSIHCMQVHKENIDKVPNALPNRNNIDIEIYGMEGIPPADLLEHDKQKQGKYDDEDDDVPSKMAKFDQGGASVGPGRLLPPPPPMPGMMPGQMMHGMPPRIGMGMPPPNAPRMMGGPPMPPMMGPLGPLPHMGMPPPFMTHGMMRGPMMPPMPPPSTTAMSSALQPQVAKPLFPVVSSAQSNSLPSSTLVGTDFKPLDRTTPTSSGAGGRNVTLSAPPKPAFPAYSSSGSNSPSLDSKSNSATISAEPTVKKSSNILTGVAGARSKIVHPDEDISLEESRARLPKYQVRKSSSSGGVGVATSSSASNNMNGMNMMRPGINQGLRGSPGIGSSHGSSSGMMFSPRGGMGGPPPLMRPLMSQHHGGPRMF